LLRRAVENVGQHRAVGLALPQRQHHAVAHAEAAAVAAIVEAVDGAPRHHRPAIAGKRDLHLRGQHADLHRLLGRLDFTADQGNGRQYDKHHRG
jgi:hypothetical protein